MNCNHNCRKCIDSGKKLLNKWTEYNLLSEGNQQQTDLIFMIKRYLDSRLLNDTVSKECGNSKQSMQIYELLYTLSIAIGESYRAETLKKNILDAYKDFLETEKYEENTKLLLQKIKASSLGISEIEYSIFATKEEKIEANKLSDELNNIKMLLMNLLSEFEDLRKLIGEMSELFKTLPDNLQAQYKLHLERVTKVIKESIAEISDNMDEKMLPLLTEIPTSIISNVIQQLKPIIMEGNDEMSHSLINVVKKYSYHNIIKMSEVIVEHLKRIEVKQREEILSAVDCIREKVPEDIYTKMMPKILESLSSLPQEFLELAKEHPEIVCEDRDIIHIIEEEDLVGKYCVEAVNMTSNDFNKYISIYSDLHSLIPSVLEPREDYLYKKLISPQKNFIIKAIYFPIKNRGRQYSLSSAKYPCLNISFWAKSDEIKNNQSRIDEWMMKYLPDKIKSLRWIPI